MIASRQSEIMRREANSLAPHYGKKHEQLIQIADLAIHSSIPHVVLKESSGYFPVKALHFWRSIGVPKETIDILLTEKGEWNHTFSPDWLLNGIEDNTLAFSEQLHRLSEPLYEPVQPVLDATGYDPVIGFNNHQLDNHIFTEIMIGSHLFHITGLKRQFRNLLLIGYYLHDNSNGENRIAHALIAARLNELMFPGWERNTQILDYVNAMIRHHDEKVAMPIIEDLYEKVEEEVEDVDQRSLVFMQRFSEIFSMFDSYLTLADKVENGRHRTLNTRELTLNSIKGDPHIYTNAVFMLDGEHLENHLTLEDKEDGSKVFEYTLTFQLQPDDKFISDVSNVMYRKKRTGRYEIYAPDDLRKSYKEKGITYFKSSCEKYLKLYYERIILTVLHAFNLDEGVSEVRYKLIDPAGRFFNKHGQPVDVEPITLVFHRDQVFEQLKLLNTVGKGTLPPHELALRLTEYTKNKEQDSTTLATS